MIMSLNNNKIKELKKQKANDKSLLFLDNPKLGFEAFKAGLEPEIILIDESKFLDLKNKFDFLNKLNKERIILVNDKIIKHFSDVKTSQGFIGVFRLQANALKKPKGNFLVLDNVQDAGNVGTLLRTALGFGFKDVFLVDCASLSNIKTIRSSMGAVFKLNVYELSLEKFINFSKTISCNLYGTDVKGKSISNCDFTFPAGIVLGNEGNGIRKEIKNILKDIISVPISTSLESLNVAVAGGIIMYEIKKNFEKFKKLI